MKKFEFTIIASGMDHEADDFEDRFFEAGCDDATIAFSRGAILLQFEREAEDIEQAIQSAIENVRAAGAAVERVEPDYLVSLSEIASRASLTKGAVSHFAKGNRGKDFPHPVARITTDSPLWDWVEVSHWLEGRGQLDHHFVVEAEVVRSFNTRIELAAANGSDEYEEMRMVG